MHVRCIVPDNFLGSYVVYPLPALSFLFNGHLSSGCFEAITIFYIHKAMHPSWKYKHIIFLVNLGMFVYKIHPLWMMNLFISVRKHLPSKCLMVCDESIHRPVCRATMLAVAEEPLIRPTEDTLCPDCCSTWPLRCTEKTSGSELIPTRWRLTEAWAQTLTSEKKRKKKHVYHWL